MSARQIPMSQLISLYTTERPATRPVLGLLAHLARMEQECREFRRELDRLVDPFDWNHHFEETNECHQYAADEDEWTA